MAAIPRNIFANFAGQAWAAAMSLLLVPLYVALLGVEAYGLIGVYATLQASLQILDLGLSQTMNRQMAYYQGLPERARDARDFVRTLELGYWGLGVILGAVITLAAPLLARHWLHAGSLPVPTVERAIRIMGLVTALQWPISFYEGGLMGLQRQVLLNALKIGVATFGGVSTALVLWLHSPTITAYFAWQGFVAALNAGILAAALWRTMPRWAGAAMVRMRLVLQHWRLAAGMGGIAITGILLSQLDKVVLSKILGLEAFGYYTLASVLSNVVPVLVAGPVFNAVFPQMTKLVAAGATPDVALLYHRGTQTMAVLASAVAGTIGWFSYEILLLWTRNSAAASTGAPIASMLVVGMGINALMAIPYALQLAHGWTSLGLRINVVLLVLFVPAIWTLVSRFGPVGAAGAWALLNALYLLVGVPLTHRRLLPGEIPAWFGDILPPAAAALAVTGIGRAIVGSQARPIVVVLEVAVVFGVALGAAALAAPLVRQALLERAARVRAWGGR